MPENKRALLGIHDDLLAGSISATLEMEGYCVRTVCTAKDMLEEACKRQYTVYIMDVNLGKPGKTDVQPAADVYEAVKLQVENGVSRFMALSGSGPTVAAARAMGIPITEKSAFGLWDFLK